MGATKKIDFLDPGVIAVFVAAVVSDMTFLGIVAIAIPGIGFPIAAMIVIIHYVTVGIVVSVLWKDIRGLFADLVFILCMVLPLPLITAGIILGIILSNKIIAFVTETVVIQGIAAATGGAGEGLEAGALAAEGAEAAAEAGAAAAEGAEAAATAGEAATAAGEAAAEGAGTAAEAGEEAAERAMEGAEERPPMENLQEEMTEKMPEPEPETPPEETRQPSAKEKAEDLLEKGHKIAQKLDEGKDQEEDQEEGNPAQKYDQAA